MSAEVGIRLAQSVEEVEEVEEVGEEEDLVEVPSMISASLERSGAAAAISSAVDGNVVRLATACRLADDRPAFGARLVTDIDEAMLELQTGWRGGRGRRVPPPEMGEECQTVKR